MNRLRGIDLMTHPAAVRIARREPSWRERARRRLGWRALGRAAPRLVLCAAMVWHGAGEVLRTGPANGLSGQLLERFASGLSPAAADGFVMGLGGVEVLLGLLVLVPVLTPVVAGCLLAHALATALPLALRSDLTWTAPFVPSLAGLYVLQHVVLILLGVAVLARIRRTGADGAASGFPDAVG